MDYTAFMPDKVLVRIFEYLKVKDITSCRMMCRKWYSCCDGWSIRKKEKCVFRADKFTSDEINDILINRRRAEISVEFVRVELDQLCFKEFGAKIQALTITDCCFDSLTNIFLCTPNMKCFTYCWNSDSGYGEKKLTKLANDLNENHLVMVNMKKLECKCVKGSIAHPKDDSITKLFARIFPRLAKIRLPSTLSVLNENLQYLLVQNQVKELWDVRFPSPFCENQLPLQHDFIKSLPRFTKLSIDLSLELRLNLEFFSHQNALETLIIRYCRDESSHAKAESGKLRVLLLHILTQCRRLKTLHFYSGYRLDLNPTDLQQFKSVTTAAASDTITDLAIPLIKIDKGTPAKFFALFNALESLEMNTCLGYDYEDPPNPTWKLSSVTLCENIAEIINTQKSLKTFIMNVYHDKFDDAVGLEENSPYFHHLFDIQYFHCLSNVQHVRSDILQYLQLNFYKWNFIIFESLISWKFPNLQTLKLGGLYGYEAAESLTSGELRFTAFVDWLQAMPSLRELYIRWFRLDDEHCLYICSRLPHLETFLYRALEPPNPRNIQMIFANYRAMRKLIIDVRRVAIEFVINRSTNVVHSRETDSSYS